MGQNQGLCVQVLVLPRACYFIGARSWDRERARVDPWSNCNDVERNGFQGAASTGTLMVQESIKAQRRVVMS